MFSKQKFSLIAAALAATLSGAAMAAITTGGVVTVTAMLTTACTTSATATIDFGSISTLGAADALGDSASTFQVACSAGLAPKIYVTGTRTMILGGAGTTILPFYLSLTPGAAADDLPATGATGSALTLTQDGVLHDVKLYARALAANIKLLPAGTYTNGSAVTATVTY